MMEHMMQHDDEAMAQAAPPQPPGAPGTPPRFGAPKATPFGRSAPAEDPIDKGIRDIEERRSEEGARRANREKKIQALLKKRSPRITLTEAQVEQLGDCFNLFDAEGSGRIPCSRLSVAFRALGCEPKKGEVRRLVSLLDRAEYEEHVRWTRRLKTLEEIFDRFTAPEDKIDDRDQLMEDRRVQREASPGTIDFADFLRVMVMKMSQKEGRREALESFRLISRRSRRPTAGVIDRMALRSIADQLGEGELSDAELDDIVGEADVSKTGVINQADFVQTMRRIGIL